MIKLIKYLIKYLNNNDGKIKRRTLKKIIKKFIRRKAFSTREKKS